MGKQRNLVLGVAVQQQKRFRQNVNSIAKMPILITITRTLLCRQKANSFAKMRTRSPKIELYRRDTALSCARSGSSTLFQSSMVAPPSRLSAITPPMKIIGVP